MTLEAATWRHAWEGKLVRFNSDNMAVVGAINKLYSRKEMLMHLLRCMTFYAAKHSFWFCAAHVPGTLNVRADALSRGYMPLFFSNSPQGTDSQGARIPAHLIQVVMDPTGDWVSESWIRQFSDTMERP